MKPMKQIGKTFVLKLKPSKTQAGSLAKWLWVCRRLYNATIWAKTFDFYDKAIWDEEKKKYVLPKGTKTISEYDIVKTYQEIAKNDPDIGEVPALMRNYVAKHVDQSYKNFFRGLKSGRKVGFPKFTTRRRYNTLRCNSVSKNKMTIVENKIRIPNLGMVPFYKDRLPPEDAKIKNFALTRKPEGWFLSIYAEFLVPVAPTAPEPEVGIDLGIANYMALSTEELISNPKYTEKYAKRLAKLSRQLSRKKGSKKGEKKSNRWKRQKDRISALHRKIANSRLDYQHKETTKIIDRFQVIAVEDLSLQNMMKSSRGTKENPGKNVSQKRGLSRSLSDAAMYQTRSLLEYKCKMKDRTFVAVPPQYTSQMCNACGHKEKGNRETQAKFVCRNCGQVAHADINAAKNILKKSKGVEI